MSSHYAALLTELGIIITKGDSHTIEKTFAFSDPVSDYLTIKSGSTPKSCMQLRSYIQSLNSTISSGDDALLDILKKESIDAHILEGQQAEDARSIKQQIMISAGLASDSKDMVAKLREFAIGLSSSKVTKVSSSADLHIIQAVNSLDEIDKVANALSSRVKEWYGLHFPELENIIDSIEGYARIVLTGRRNDLTVESFENAGFPSEKTEMLLVAASNSRGGEITDKSLEMVQTMAEQMIASYNLRRSLEELIEDEIGKIAPNLSAILGTSLSARMLARIGSIKRMATLPASTIQILGAERALFRSLKTGSEPPKHGLLFQHPMVHAAPRWQRGKIARAIAAKAVIAVRVDVYNKGSGLNNTLLEKLNIRVGEINEKFQEPVEKSDTYDKARSSRQQNSRTTTTYKEKRRDGGGSRHQDSYRKSGRGEYRDRDSGGSRHQDSYRKSGRGEYRDRDSGGSRHQDSYRKSGRGEYRDRDSGGSRHQDSYRKSGRGEYRDRDSGGSRHQDSYRKSGRGEYRDRDSGGSRHQDSYRKSGRGEYREGSEKLRRPEWTNKRTRSSEFTQRKERKKYDGDYTHNNKNRHNDDYNHSSNYSNDQSSNHYKNRHGKNRDSNEDRYDNSKKNYSHAQIKNRTNRYGKNKKKRKNR